MKFSVVIAIVRSITGYKMFRELFFWTQRMSCRYSSSVQFGDEVKFIIYHNEYLH